MFYAYYIVVDLNLTHIYQYLFILWALRIFQKNLHGTMSLPICYTVIGPWSKFLKVVTILCNFFLTYCPTPFSNWFIATCYDPSHHIFNTFQESFWYLWCMKILSHWAKLDYFIYPLIISLPPPNLINLWCSAGIKWKFGADVGNVILNLHRCL